MQLTNLGLQLRPDLTDAHTLHWHGFRNVIFFDGEPLLCQLLGNTLLMFIARAIPVLYMYHCHVEDIEHVTMGMTGIVFLLARCRMDRTSAALQNLPTTMATAPQAITASLRC